MEETTLTSPKVTDKQANTRLDRFLTSCFPDYSRERLKQLIQEGCVFNSHTNIVATSASAKVKEGDTFTITPPAPTSLNIEAEDIPLEILYEDAHLIVINKPAGMTVHPAGPMITGTLVNALLHHCKSLSGIGGVERPGIVHRLDKGTSGVMVVAKDDKTHNGLSKQFSDRTMDRFYLALCYGMPAAKKGTIETMIGRHPKNRKKMAVIEGHKGKSAITTYQSIKHAGLEATLVRFKLMTGRTHQIRVHSQHAGFPIIGDPVYGKRKKLSIEGVNELISGLNHQMLHAQVLGFEHPISKEKLYFETDLPQDMQKLKNKLFK